MQVTTKFPSVYTKVSYYVDWISKTIEMNQDQYSEDEGQTIPDILLQPRGSTPDSPQVINSNEDNRRQTISQSYV